MISRILSAGALILFAAGVCGLSGACSSPTGQEGDELTMLIGTYTGEGSEGIYAFRFNQETGKATLTDSTHASNPSYVIASADGSRVYAVSENNDSTDGVSAYAFAKDSGKLSFLNKVSTGMAPCHLSTNGKMLLSADYEGGTLSFIPLQKDGSLENVRKAFHGVAKGADTLRQATPHVHCSAFTPDGGRVIVSDFGGDRLMCIRVSDGGDSLQSVCDSVLLEPGSGPRHLVFSPDGKRLYLIGELSGKIVVFDYLDGRLVRKQVVEADEAHARGSADIHLSPDGKFLYASNRLKHDGIAIFKVDGEGLLTKAGYQLTGKHPRNFGITPNGKYLLVACRDDNRVQVFERNSETGMLRDTRRDIPVSRAVCVRFVR